MYDISIIIDALRNGTLTISGRDLLLHVHAVVIGFRAAVEMPYNPKHQAGGQVLPQYQQEDILRDIVGDIARRMFPR